ncbi:Ethanolamine utilization protein EutN [Anaerolineales bacterium]|nr:Ethanolamine utilization protein EutN [Anaerolineales bacterium]
MRIAKVVGVAVATVKDRRLEGGKCLLVAATDSTGKELGTPFVAVDMMGAGEGELVMIAEGSSARVATKDTSSPVDAVIVGILDSLQHNGKMTYTKS